MSLTLDQKCTLALALIFLLLVTSYRLRIARKGRARFDRVEHQGGSRLLNTAAMEMAYWALQPAARLLVFLRITPNAVSWTSFAFGFLAGACLAVGYFGFAAVCGTVSGLLDCIDGMVARLSGAASDAGEILDAAVDRYVEFFFLSGLVIYYREIPLLQLLALAALAGSFMVSYSTAKAEALQIESPKGGMRRPERALYLSSGAALSAVSIPWLEAPRPFPIGYPMVAALALIAVGANVSAIARLRSIAKTIRLYETNPTDARDAAVESSAAERPERTREDGQPAGIRHPV